MSRRASRCLMRSSCRGRSVAAPLVGIGASEYGRHCRLGYGLGLLRGDHS